MLLELERRKKGGERRPQSKGQLLKEQTRGFYFFKHARAFVLVRQPHAHSESFTSRPCPWDPISHMFWDMFDFFDPL